MTATLDDIASDIAKIVSKLALPQRKELIAKIYSSACGGKVTSIDGELASVDAKAGEITSLSASTAEAASVKLTPIMAANAGPNGLALVRNVMARAKRLGYTLKENETVDVDAMNAAFSKSTNIEERMAVKAGMHRLGLI